MSAVTQDNSLPLAQRAGQSAAPAAWQLSALLRPAHLPAAPGLSPVARLWLDWVLQAVADGLERTLDRPVTVDVTDQAGEGARLDSCAFGIKFSHPACPGEGLLVIELPLARMLLDSLESDFASLRGTGNLSSAELGLLEYIALACVDHVVRMLAPLHSPFALRGFASGQELEQRARECASSPAFFVARIGGRDGLARLYLTGWEGSDLSVLADVRSSFSDPDPSATVELGLALPPVRLPSAEIARLEPGDIVLLGMSQLEGLASCRLVTSTGWSVSSASVLRDSPTLVTVQCGEFAVEVWPPGPPRASAADSVPQTVTARIGSIALAVEQLQGWRCGAVLDLPKHLELPVELYDGPALVARGELVKLEGEIGMRVVERC